MTPTKSEPLEPASVPPPAPSASPASPSGLAPVSERGTPIDVLAHRAPQSGRVVLYERLTGAAARERATGAEPHGAGMPGEEAAKVEYVEVWSTPPPANGYDFRMYSFGGTLLATRSTRA